MKRPTPDHQRRDPNAWNLDDASVVENVELLDWTAQSKLPLLGAGADPNVRNNAGQTAIDVAKTATAKIACPSNHR